jgi:hypothetical protein
MKLYLGWVVSAGVMATAAAANAQVLVPYRIGAAPTVVISDVDGPYAAIPPEMAVPRYGPPVLPPREIYAIVRENGFAPLGAPQQRGLVYTVAAIDRDGEDGRLVIDARYGRIVRFMPAYRMGDRMGEETVTAYGPVGALPPAPDYRRPPRPAGGATARQPYPLGAAAQGAAAARGRRTGKAGNVAAGGCRCTSGCAGRTNGAAGDGGTEAERGAGDPARRSSCRASGRCGSFRRRGAGRGQAVDAGAADRGHAAGAGAGIEFEETSPAGEARLG